MLSNFNIDSFVVAMLVFVIAITIHEFAHAISADRLGDPTPRNGGRISINPVDHLDAIGTVMMVITNITGFGIGWGRPVLVNPANFRHPRRDMIIVAIAGPISNLLQALIFAGVFRVNNVHQLYPSGSMMEEFVYQGVWLNLSLMFFNMIPIPPLDGSKVLSGILPMPHAQVYDKFMQQFGLILFLILALTRVAGKIIAPEVQSLFDFLTGLS